MTIENFKTVRVTHKLKRRIQIKGDFARDYFKKWEKEELAQPITGLAIQEVTLANGLILYNDFGNTFVPKEHLRAVKVAYSIRRNPILVALEDCEFEVDK